MALDPAQEVKETCELALRRIEQLKDSGNECESSTVEKSPFMSVDPAAPASSNASICQLRYIEPIVTNAIYYLLRYIRKIWFDSILFLIMVSNYFCYLIYPFEGKFFWMMIRVCMSGMQLCLLYGIMATMKL